MAHPLFSFLRSFFSSDFTDESEAFLLIGLLTDFRGYLASGQWLAPEIFPYCFCHADFANDADFSSWDYFVPQISQIYTDFLHHDFSSSDFTDESEAFLLIGLLTEFRRTLAAGQWLAPDICSCCFLSHRFHRYTQIFYGISGESLCQSQGVSATTGQVASAKIRE